MLYRENLVPYCRGVLELLYEKLAVNGTGRDTRRSCAHYEVFGAGGIAENAKTCEVSKTSQV